MKRSMKRISACCLAAAMVLPLWGGARAAEKQTVHGALWNHYTRVEDVYGAFFDGNGKERIPIAWNNTMYIPLRTVGAWLGGDVEWDQAAMTVRLTSGVREASYPTLADVAKNPSTAEDLAQFQKDLEQGVDVELRPDIKVTLNGEEQQFRNAAGETVYPMLFRECVYLPLRNIGELSGKRVLWYAGEEEGGQLYLYAPPTAAELESARTYFDRCEVLLDGMAGQAAELKGAVALNDDTLRQKITGIKTELEKLAGLTHALIPLKEGMSSVRMMAWDIINDWNASLLLPEDQLSAPAGEYEAGTWQERRDRCVEDLERELPRIRERVIEGRKLLNAVAALEG